MSLNNNCGVYLITSPSNGRYIGSSRNLKKRFNRYKNLSCGKQHALLASLKKYGYSNHIIKIIYYCLPEELLFWERVFGDLYLALADHENGLNIRLPAYDEKCASITKEARERIKEGCRRRFSNPDEIKKISEKAKKALSDPELRNRMSISHKKRWTPELRKNKSDSRKKYYADNPDAKQIASNKTKEYFKNNPDKKEIQQTGLVKFYQENPTIRKDRMVIRYQENPGIGKEHSEKLKKYYEDNPEARKRASEISKAQFADPANNIRSKKVIDTTTNEEFPCAKIVAEKINVSYNTLRNWLNNISPNPTSYIWKK